MQSTCQRTAETRWLTCPVSPQRALWGFGIAAPPVWSSSGSPAHTSSGPPHSGEWKHRERQVSPTTSETQPQCQSSTDLLEALQDSLHVLIPPEKVGKGALHRVEVGYRLIPLGRQLPDWLTAGEGFLLLLILCGKHRNQKIKINKYESVNLVENWHATPVWLGWNSFAAAMLRLQLVVLSLFQYCWLLQWWW